MLGAIAEQTSRVEFGPLVNCNVYRNPDLQADMARTLDHISDGRFIFGTGSGWFERDFTEYGYEFGTAGSRLDALAADLPRIRERWTKLNPAPTRDIPILIGGGGEQKTLKIVAEHADIWHSFSDPDTLVRKLDVLRHWCEVVGRDFAEIELSTGTSLRGMGSLDRTSLEKYRSLGVTLFEYGINAGADLTTVRDLLAWRDSVEG
jgi:probable F420-dependent oxidoreductase